MGKYLSLVDKKDENEKGYFDPEWEREEAKNLSAKELIAKIENHEYEEFVIYNDAYTKEELDDIMTVCLSNFVSLSIVENH